MSKHTAGPWKTVSIPSNCPRQTSEQCDVVEVNGTAPDGRTYKVATVYWKRDQELIAAAPDLLAESKELIRQFRKTDFSGEVFLNIEPVISRLLAAIAKAEGK